MIVCGKPGQFPFDVRRAQVTDGGGRVTNGGTKGNQHQVKIVSNGRRSGFHVLWHASVRSCSPKQPPMLNPGCEPINSG